MAIPYNKLLQSLLTKSPQIHPTKNARKLIYFFQKERIFFYISMEGNFSCQSVLSKITQCIAVFLNPAIASHSFGKGKRGQSSPLSLNKHTHTHLNISWSHSDFSKCFQWAL